MTKKLLISKKEMIKMYSKNKKYQDKYGSFDRFLADQKQYFDGQNVKYSLID
tara:strand:+ start:356 stop:511 length:156 start_codon:yes stop_codon:yes gene_type:complete